MSRIRAVLFDFDGVLTTHPTGSRSTVGFLEHALALPADVIARAFAPHNRDLLLGRTSHAAIWPEVRAALGRNVDLSILRDAFDATPRNVAMLALARSLAREVAVGIVTDNRLDRIDRLADTWSLRELFDPIVVSASVGSTKSDRAIFEHALAHLGVHPHEALFIDNTPDNLVAPRALGLHVEHFDDARNDVDALALRLRSVYGLGASPADTISSASA